MDNEKLLADKLENAQARLLKLEVWTKSAILNLLTGTEPDTAALECALREALDDIGAAKNLLAEVMSGIYPDKDADEGECV